jgi:hypothetical protein
MALMAGCSALRTQDLTVVMIEGPWSVDPASFADAGSLALTFSNGGSEVHQPLLALTEGTVTDLESHLAGYGDANLVDELAGDDALRGYGVALLYGTRGHFHEGGPDVIELPPDARVAISEDTTTYLFTSSIAPGEDHDVSLSIGNFLDGGGGAKTFAVVCMSPDHTGRGEWAVFGIDG